MTDQPDGVSRRRLLQGAGAVGVAAWLPHLQIPAAAATLPTPPDLPRGHLALPAGVPELVRRDPLRRRLDLRPGAGRW